MADDLSRQLGNALRDARSRLGYTQAEAAERAGMAVEAYARLERGLVVPRASTLRDLAKALEVSADAVLGLERRATPAAGGSPPELRRLQRLAGDLDARALRLVVAVAAELHRRRERPRRR